MVKGAPRDPVGNADGNAVEHAVTYAIGNSQRDVDAYRDELSVTDAVRNLGRRR